MPLIEDERLNATVASNCTIVEFLAVSETLGFYFVKIQTDPKKILGNLFCLCVTLKNCQISFDPLCDDDAAHYTYYKNCNFMIGDKIAKIVICLKTITSLASSVFRRILVNHLIVPSAARVVRFKGKWGLGGLGGNVVVRFGNVEF